MNLFQPCNSIKVHIATLAVYTCFLLGILVVVLKLSPFTLSEVQTGLIKFDAIHYEEIKNYGYLGGITAFFPLFPLVWRFLHLSAVGISMLNIAIFFIGFLVLAKTYRFSIVETALLVSIPSLIFLWLPFTESFFYFAGALIVLGYKRQNQYLLILGFLLAGLTRPAAIIFFPAIILTEFLSDKPRKALCRATINFAVLAGAFLLATWIQYLDTSEWFGYLRGNGWDGHDLKIPNLPLTSWGGYWIVPLDGSALFIGIVCSTLILKQIYMLVFKNKYSVQKDYLFAVLYIAGISMLKLLLSLGYLYSLNRFVFGTTFFTLFLFYILKQKYTQKFIWLLFGGLVLYWLLFASYVHLQAFLKFLGFSFYIVSFLLLTSNARREIKTPYAVLLFLLNISFQVLLLYKYFENEWVA